jgi:hypothetical protein
MSIEDLEREDEDLADYDIGFQAGLDGEPFDESTTGAWKRGWKDAGSEEKSGVL